LTAAAGAAKASGLETKPMRHKGAVLFHTSGDKVTRLIVYYDRERALADLGLASETDESNRPGRVSR
jgi:hypothetical protein